MVNICSVDKVNCILLGVSSSITIEIAKIVVMPLESVFDELAESESC